MDSAISREKAMKKWLRKWKLSTIEKSNPEWRDLWPEIIGAVPPAVVPANAGTHTPVVPANAGTQDSATLDSRIRGNDEGSVLL